MNLNPETKIYDGEYEIIFSESFNIYEDELIIQDFLGFKFFFDFETKDPEEGQQDIAFEPGKEVKEFHIKVSKKFRNTLGSANSSKLKIFNLNDEENRSIYFTIYGQQVGSNNTLNITLTFYVK